MTPTARYRGHRVFYADGFWCYVDGVRIEETERPCVKCGEVAEGLFTPDPCLGCLSGVSSACCGHGVIEPYVMEVKMELRPEIVEKIQNDHTFRNGKQFVGGGWPPYDKTKQELLAK